MGAPGTPYRPSNGTEGMDFIDDFCGRCIHDRAYRNDTGPSCEIVCRALIYGVGDPEYPREWRYDANGAPTCTAFIEDSGNEDQEPPVDPDPTQLVLLADPTEDIAELKLQHAEDEILDLVEVVAHEDVPVSAVNLA